MEHNMRLDNDGPIHNGTTNTFGKEADLPRDEYSSDENGSSSTLEEKQAGVKRIEAVSKSWTKTSLIVAYVAWVFLHAAHQ